MRDSLSKLGLDYVDEWLMHVCAQMGRALRQYRNMDK